MTLDPTTIDFPEPIETERLIIRGPRPGDGPVFNAAVLDTLEGITTWLGYYRDGPPTVAQSESFMRKEYARFVTREYMMLLVFLKETGFLVACSGLHPKWDVPSFEIGYWCRTPYSGNGYVTEAVRAQTDLAFNHLGARRVFIRCDTRNQASANVATRAGFAWEATLACDSRSPEGHLRDTHYFALTKPD